MSSLFEMLTSQLGGGALKAITSQLGSDEKKTGAAVGMALPAILGALSRNAAKPEGAQALASALSNDHDGSALDNMTDMFKNAQSGPGNGILKHVLGNRRGAVENSIGKASGLGSDGTAKLMAMLAPVVMGALGKTQRQKSLDPSALSNLLTNEATGFEKKIPGGGMITKMLDQDGDGDVDLSDLTKGVIGKLFGR